MGGLTIGEFTPRVYVHLESSDFESLVEGLFVLALVWSLGATCEAPGRGRMATFLHALLLHNVDPRPERGDFDLGPGMAITYPAAPLQILLPEVTPRLLSCFPLSDAWLASSCGVDIETDQTGR